MHVSYVVPITLGVLTTLAVGLLVSCFFPKPRQEQLRGLNIWCMEEKEKKEL